VLLRLRAEQHGELIAENAGELRLNGQAMDVTPSPMLSSSVSLSSMSPSLRFAASPAPFQEPEQACMHLLVTDHTTEMWSDILLDEALQLSKKAVSRRELQRKYATSSEASSAFKGPKPDTPAVSKEMDGKYGISLRDAPTPAVIGNNSIPPETFVILRGAQNVTQLPCLFHWNDCLGMCREEACIFSIGDTWRCSTGFPEQGCARGYAHDLYLNPKYRQPLPGSQALIHAAVPFSLKSCPAYCHASTDDMAVQSTQRKKWTTWRWSIRVSHQRTGALGQTVTQVSARALMILIKPSSGRWMDMCALSRQVAPH
jgi:hypothetical protein